MADKLSYLGEETQTEYGRLFELLADLIDEDGALAEMQNLGDILIDPDVPEGEKPPIPPTGENLFEVESSARLPELYSGEEQGLDVLSAGKILGALKATG